MEKIREAILNGATGEQLAAMPLPSEYRAAHIRKADQDMFAGVASEDKDPRSAIHIGA
jgi:crotonyl-CoA reductase